MPWVTSNIYPSSSAFYSPVTACPTSWTPVATHTTGVDQWVTGETALQCCPDGFVGDGGSGCRPGSSGSWPVVECGEADEDENELKTYSAAAWPSTAIASITALQLRYQASDIGSVSTTSGAPTSTGSNGEGGSGNGGGGLSTAAIAAIATVIPLVFIIGALAAFFLWRRRKHRKQAVALLASKSLLDEKAGRPPGSLEAVSKSDLKNSATGIGGGTTIAAVNKDSSPHETPEWNAELDASEAERQRLMSPTSTVPVSATSTGDGSEAAELGGMARVRRKPIQPVELDSTPMTAEVGDAYIPYRAGGVEER